VSAYQLDWPSFRAWREAVTVSDPFGEYISRSQTCVDELIAEAEQVDR
jgi:hypothetical protein